MRALKTAAQSAISIIGIEAVTLTGLDWPFVFEASALAALLSFFMSIAGLPELKQPMIDDKERK